MKNDHELLRCYVEEKSETAFAELVQRHLPSVYGAALRRVGGDAHLAKDVAQHVFTALAREAKALSRRPVLAGWLHTTTRYAAAQVVRAERRRHAREEEAHVMQELSTDSLAPDEWGKLRPLLDEAMDGLQERDREAVLLRFYEERSFAEIGAALRMSEDAARVRVNRALDKLHAALGRRGVKSTVAALGVALANHIGATAIPAGLGAAITGAALIGGSLAGSAAVSGGIFAAAGVGKVATGVAVAAVGLAGGIAWEQHRQTREWEARAAEMQAQRHALQARVKATEAQLQQAEQRASEAERDNGELLQAVLAGQNAPVNVTLVSDGETIVSIVGFRGPSRFQRTSVRVLPGNYEVLGRRPGYQDVVVRLELRGGSPPPPLTIACTVPDRR